ncbi:MAG: hypothetical protein GX434_06490 [Peptococcaceae bacterium]|nr:hypothetical protein [Peptococcaceae bacterium]
MNKYFYEHGFVSLLIILVLAFLSWQGISVFAKTSSNERIARYEAQKLKAAYAADSGLEYAKSLLKQDPFWNGGIREFAGGRITIGVVRTVKEYTITARAEIGNSVQVRYGKFLRGEDNSLLPTEYGELYQ